MRPLSHFLSFRNFFLVLSYQSLFYIKYIILVLKKNIVYIFYLTDVDLNYLCRKVYFHLEM